MTPVHRPAAAAVIVNANIDHLRINVAGKGKEDRRTEPPWPRNHRPTDLLPSIKANLRTQIKTAIPVGTARQGSAKLIRMAGQHIMAAGSG